MNALAQHVDTLDRQFFNTSRLQAARLCITTIAIAGITTAVSAAPAKPVEVVIADQDAVMPSTAFQEPPLDSSETVISDAQESLLDGMLFRKATRGRRDPAWTGAVDALMLWRGNAPGLPIFTDASGAEAVNANEVLPGMSAGPRFMLMRQVGCKHAIEGNYFQIEPFTGTASLPANAGPYTITDLGGLPSFGDIAAGTVSTNGSIRSAELNWRTWNGRSINWLGGFRWVEWNETMNIDYTFENPNRFRSGGLQSSTGNNLYGGQLGADARFWNRSGRVRVNGIGKAGIFYNSASYQRSSANFVELDGTVFPVGAVAATADQTSFFGEVGLNASYSLTKWLSWRLGYNVFWLSGVATAPQQFAVSNIPGGTAQIDTNGSVLLHGVNTGIEARW